MSMEAITFFVPGLPAPGGSKRGFFNKNLNRVMIVDANKNAKPWKVAVAAFASSYWGNRPLLSVALHVEFTFTLPRPQAHFRSNGELRPASPNWHTKKPDALKLARSTEDALTGIVWRDDSLTAELVSRKVYGDKPGCTVSISILQDAGSARGESSAAPELAGAGLFVGGAT